MHFNKALMLPINNIIIKTATDNLLKVNRQACITVLLQGMELEMCVNCKNLIHDVILGLDKLTKQMLLLILRIIK